MVDKERLLELLPRLADRLVLVVGDVSLDEYVSGRATRLSREAPIPVLDFTGRGYLPGALLLLVRRRSGTTRTPPVSPLKHSFISFGERFRSSRTLEEAERRWGGWSMLAAHYLWALQDELRKL